MEHPSGSRSVFEVVQRRCEPLGARKMLEALGRLHAMKMWPSCRVSFTGIPKQGEFVGPCHTTLFGPNMQNGSILRAWSHRPTLGPDVHATNGEHLGTKTLSPNLGITKQRISALPCRTLPPLFTLPVPVPLQPNVLTCFRTWRPSRWLHLWGYRGP